MDKYDAKAKMRLLDKRIVNSNGCWEFKGAINSSGYGSIGYKGRVIAAHILSFMLLHLDEYISYLQVCHKCNNRKCFNPEHLEQGNQSKNTKDSVLAGTHNMASKTHCPRGHEYSTKNTYTNPITNRRHCRICKKAYDNFKSFLKGL